MSFLQPWMLFALPALLIPIIIHLLNRRRHRTVEWGAMMFLLQATRQSRGHARLRHLLILAARALAIAALIFAVSRPLTSGWLGIFDSAPDTVVLVLDRSASLAQQDLQTAESKRSSALRQIGRVLETTGRPKRLALISTGMERPVELPDVEALDDHPATWQTDSPSDLPALLDRTLEYLVANRAGRTEVWIASDLQRSDWGADAGRWGPIESGFSQLEQSVRFHVLAFDQAPDDDLAVRVERCRVIERPEGSDLLLDLTLTRRGPPVAAETTRHVPVGVVVGEARSVIDVEMVGDWVELRDHRVPLDGLADRGWGRLDLPNDSDPRDNQFWFAFGESPPQRTLLVTRQPALVQVLAIAAAPPDDSLDNEVRVLSPDALGTEPLDEVACILWQGPLPEGAQAHAVEAFVGEGGTVIFLPDASEVPSDTELFGVSWGAWETGQEEIADGPSVAGGTGGQPVAGLTVESWTDDSDLLAKVASGASLPVGSVVLRRARRIEGDARVLARLSNAAPFLARARTEAGAAYFFASLVDGDESNLARQGVVLFVALQRAIESGAQRLLSSRLSAIGESLATLESREWTQLGGWKDGALSSERLLQAGVWDIDGRLVARNRPESEDSAPSLSHAEVEQLFGALDVRILSDVVGSDSPLVSEIWRFFLIGMIVALLIEAWLCLPDRASRKLEAAA